MKRFLTSAPIQLLLTLIAVGVGGCAPNEGTHSLHGSQRSGATLECRAPTSDGPIMSMFSLSLARPVRESKHGDLCLYFDSHDCSGGAIVGHHDEKGWLFPIGRYSWPELEQHQKLPTDGDSTEGIRPITKAQEGFSFWVKTVSGRHAIVRIAVVRSATYDEVVGGKAASVEFEWMWR